MLSTSTRVAVSHHRRRRHNRAKANFHFHTIITVTKHNNCENFFLFCFFLSLSLNLTSKWKKRARCPPLCSGVVTLHLSNCFLRAQKRKDHKKALFFSVSFLLLLLFSLRQVLPAIVVKSGDVWICAFIFTTCALPISPPPPHL